MILPSTYWGGELNRCTITTKNGPMLLSVPIYDSRKQQEVQDIRICYMHAWQRQHWAAIYSAYGKTPYFEYYADYIRPIYEKQPEWLVDLNDETAYILSCLIHNNSPYPALQPPFPPPLTLLGRDNGKDEVKAIIQPNILDLLMEFGPVTIKRI